MPAPQEDVDGSQSPATAPQAPRGEPPRSTYDDDPDAHDVRRARRDPRGRPRLRAVRARAARARVGRAASTSRARRSAAPASSASAASTCERTSAARASAAPTRPRSSRSSRWPTPSIAAYISIHNMVAWMIDTYGTDEQRQRVASQAHRDDRLRRLLPHRAGRRLRRRGARDERDPRRRRLRADGRQAVHLRRRRGIRLRRHGAHR